MIGLGRWVSVWRAPGLVPLRGHEGSRQGCSNQALAREDWESGYHGQQNVQPGPIDTELNPATSGDLGGYRRRLRLNRQNSHAP